jgi:hypothetical protein
MNSKHVRTLGAAFADPVSRTIAWSDLEALLLAAGAVLVEGTGSRVSSGEGRLSPPSIARTLQRRPSLTKCGMRGNFW